MDLIAIPSSGRADRQQTLYELQKTGVTKLYKTVVVVYPEEAKKYKYMRFKGKRVKAEVVTVPKRYGHGIHKKREFICTELARKMGARYVLLLDDDLHFCYRPHIQKPYMGYIHNIPERMHRMVAQLDRWLRDEKFVQVGLISRQANRVLGKYHRQPQRAMNAWAVDTRMLRQLGIKFGRVPLMEDFDLTLQILEKGYPNRISCRYAWTTISNLKGGCSKYRTPEMQLAAAKKLQRLHPGVVTLVKREAKSWRGGLNERVDVRIDWQSALRKRA